MRLWRRAKDEIKYLDLRIARAKLTLRYNWWLWHETQILNIKYEKFLMQNAYGGYGHGNENENGENNVT